MVEDARYTGYNTSPSMSQVPRVPEYVHTMVVMLWAAGQPGTSHIPPLPFFALWGRAQKSGSTRF